MPALTFSPQAWFLPLTVLVHTAGAVLHEGPPFGLTIRRRTTALAICAPIGMFIFFWAATLFGASVVEHGWNTLHWAALMASIVVSATFSGPCELQQCCSGLGQRPKSEEAWQYAASAGTTTTVLPLLQVAPMAAVAGLEGRRWQYVFAHWSPSGTDELSAAVPAFAAILATWLGAFPTPLDWGTQWQVGWCSPQLQSYAWVHAMCSEVDQWHIQDAQLLPNSTA